MNLDGYVRVSRVGDREGEGFISPDVQEKAICAWAAQHGHTLTIQPHELNVSGGTMDRPVFNSIMQRIRSGRTDGIVVYKLDRFARTLLGAIGTLSEIGEHDAIFASATEPALDYATPAGRAFMQQMFVFAEFVRSTTKEGWATAQRHAVERGIHISPNGYLGYDKTDDGRLVPNADAPRVVEMFKRRGRGDSWTSIADYFNEAIPKSEGMWTYQSVQRLCAHRVYLGEASRYVHQDIDGRGPIVNRDAHPPLVTEAHWQAAQMNPRIATGGRKTGDPLPLLSGLIRCASCRYSMSPGRGPNGEHLYRCRGKYAAGRCAKPAAVLRDVIEAHVQNYVLAQINAPARLVPDTEDRERAVAALEVARADLDDFRRDRSARRKLGAEWHDWLDEYLRAVKDAEDAIGLLDAHSGVAIDGMTVEHFLTLPVDSRREVLAGFIDAVMVRRSVGRGRNVDPMTERSRILWRGDGPSDLPRPRISSPIVPFVFEEEDIEARMALA